MDPNPAIYNKENVPTGLKCFHSGECHICKDGNPIALDTNFNITGYVAIPVHTMIGGVSATYRKWKTQTTNALQHIPVRSHDISSGTKAWIACNAAHII